MTVAVDMILRYHYRRTKGIHATMSGPRRFQQTAILDRYSRRFLELKQEFQGLEYFCKGTLLKRMMKCGKARCACRNDPAKRHGPYFEWTYKAQGKTVNVKLTAAAAPLYRAAAQQHRKLKSLLNRLERLSQAVLRHQAKLEKSARSDGS